MSTEKVEVATAEREPLRAATDVDEALLFIKNNEHVDVAAENVDEKALVRKIDRRMLFTMFLCYFTQFVDKTLLNYGNVMGLSKDLKLKGNEFSQVVTAYSVAYLVAEIPTSFILHKVPVGTVLACNVLLWGICTGCTAATHNFATLLVVRIFLGLSEGGIGPCLIIITSKWYTIPEQSPRFGFWFSGLGFGQIVGGLLSFAFQSIHSTFTSWRIMFLSLGILTFMLGVSTYVVMPDNPMTAAWLSREERLFAVKRLSRNQTGIENRYFKMRHLGEALADPQYWMLFLLTVLAALPSGFISSFSAAVIVSFGFTPRQSALLNMPGGIVILIAVGLSSYAVGRASHRWLWAGALAVPGTIGGVLTSVLPNSNVAGLLIGIYLINCIVGTVNMVYMWTSANIAGYTKKIVMATTVHVGFALGNILSPFAFRAQDAPKYLPAKRMVLGSQAGTILVAILLRLYYGWQNVQRRRRAETEAEVGIEGEQEVGEKAWLNLTDQKNTAFTYRY